MVLFRCTRQRRHNASAISPHQESLSSVPQGLSGISYLPVGLQDHLRSLFLAVTVHWIHWLLQEAPLLLVLSAVQKLFSILLVVM